MPLISFAENPQAISQGDKVSINKQLHAMGNYFRSIPLDTIFGILERHSVVVVQEDGTKWAGFVTPTGKCGEEKGSPITFDLAILVDGKYRLAKNKLVMTACVMPSGSIEVVSYIS